MCEFALKLYIRTLVNNFRNKIFVSWNGVDARCSSQVPYLRTVVSATCRHLVAVDVKRKKMNWSVVFRPTSSTRDVAI